MESAYRMVHFLSPEFMRTFNWSSFVPGLESCDLTVKWLVHVCLLSVVVCETSFEHTSECYDNIIFC